MKNKLVYGKGINDADYVVQERSSYTNTDGKRVFTTVKVCPYYVAWVQMITRCYSEKHLKHRPSYKDCSVCEEWLTFSNFKAWMETQDWEGKVLDKDWLLSGNRTYSQNTCIFITAKLNTFCMEVNSRRGQYPLGVTAHCRNNMVTAGVSNPFTGKREYLGLFTDPQEAHEAWRKRKHELALMYAELQTDERVKQALSVKYSKEVWYNK